jgi:hypothetical protein
MVTLKPHKVTFIRTFYDILFETSVTILYRRLLYCRIPLVLVMSQTAHCTLYVRRMAFDSNL